MKPESKRYSATVGTGTVAFETGKLAAQAGGAVTVGIEEAVDLRGRHDGWRPRRN